MAIGWSPSFRGTGEQSRRLGGDLREHRVGHRRAEDDGQVVGRRPTRPARPVQARRGRRVGVHRAQRGRFGVHLGHGGARATQHVRQRVGRVVTRHQQQAVQQLARRVGAAGFDAHTVALDLAVGRVGDHGRVQAQLVKGHQRQQHLDGAGRRMTKILVACGQHLTRIEIRDQPGLSRPVGDGHRAHRLHAGVRPSSCAGADKGEDSRYCGEKLPHGHRAYRPAAPSLTS